MTLPTSSTQLPILFVYLTFFKSHWLLFFLFLKHQICSHPRVFAMAVPPTSNAHFYTLAKLSFLFLSDFLSKNVPFLSYCRYEDVPPDPISRKNMLLSCGEYNQQIASSHQLLQGLPPLQKMAHSTSCLSCGSPHSLAE